jgi:hypothetical protein
MKKYIIIAITVIGLFSCKKNNTSPSNTNTSNSAWEKRSDLSIFRNAFSIGETLFCSNSRKGMKSKDGGQTWESCTKNLIQQLKNNNLIGFLDTNFRGVFSDGVSLYVPVSQTMKLSIYDPMPSHIYKSNDFGNSWNRVFKDQPLVGVNNITFISNKIFVQSSNKISVSSDGGFTWSDQIVLINSYLESTDKVVTDGTNFYTTCNYRLFKSTNSGISFLPVASDTLESPQNIVAKNSELYCISSGKNGNNIYQSLNNAENWSSTNATSLGKTLLISIDDASTGFTLYTDNLKLYAGCKSECFVFDNTKTWKSLGKYSNENISHTYSLIKHNGYLYAFTDEGVYRLLE